MPFTLVSFNESEDAAAAFVRIAGTGGEQHVTVSGDDITVPELNKIVAAGVCLDTTVAAQARLRSPSLVARGHEEYLQPFNSGLVFADPPRVADYRFNPIELTKAEALGVEILDNPAGAVQRYVGVWLADGPITPVTGNIQTIRATTGITQVVTGWTAGALTFPTSLKAGRYQVVGARCVMANGVFGRLVFPGGNWRPGCPVCTTSQIPDNPMFRRGQMGVWGEFSHASPPVAEVLGVTNTAQEWMLDLIYAGA